MYSVLLQLYIHFLNCFFFALQVKIFEEDFRKERSDRERMNEEKEDLRRQVERLQGQITNLTNQVSCVFKVCSPVCCMTVITELLSNVGFGCFMFLQCVFCGSASSGAERVSERTYREV